MLGKNTTEIPIDALATGMTVVKLDISWLNSPFLSHTRKIKDERDIQALKDAGVKRLIIDLDRSPAPSPEFDERLSGATDERGQQADEQPPPMAKPAPIAAAGAPATLQEELKTARNLRNQVKNAVQEIQKKLELDTPVRLDELTPLVDATLASLERNNQALLSLAHLSRKAQKLADHAFGTFCLALNLARLQQLASEEREALGVAALLHDMGWTQLPLQLMGKRSTYTALEQRLVQQHVTLAAKLLAQSDLPQLVLRVIAEHQERADGSGYPKGLKREALHPLSLLLGVVDEYEERVHQLQDSPGMVPTNALRALYKDADKGRFDVAGVAAFISMLGIYPVMSAVQLNTGELALIRELHAEAPLNPTIQIHYRAVGKPLAEPLWVDLRDAQESNGRQIDTAVDPRDPAVDPLRRLLPEEHDLS